MKRRTHIQLTPYEDLFSTEEQRQDYHREKVMDIPLSELHPFKDHLFKVLDDDRMADTTRSVQEHGVLVPAIARPRADGGYELISGHRRKRACELAGLDTMPVIVLEMDDNTAVLVMVDSNIQRENILPSERAFAYKMKLEALRRQGKRSDLTSSQVGMKLQALDIVGQESGESRNQVHRYIRLTHLIPQLLTMVDEKKIAFNPAVELSYLKQEEQAQLLDAMESEQATPSLSQAQRLKRFSQEDKLSPAVMSAILSEEKKVVQEQMSFSAEALRKYFPKSYTPQQMETVIFRLLDTWQRKRQQQQER